MKAARPDTWMPLYWGDYLRDTMHLRAEAHGAYLLLIGHYWTSGQPLPDDDEYLTAVSRLEAKGWKRLKPTLAKFFTVSDGVWRHARVDEELQRAISISKARQEAGKRGGKKSATARAKPQPNDEARVEANAKQNPTQSQSPSPLKKDAPDGASKEKRKRGTRLPDDWAPEAAEIEWCRSEGYPDDHTQREVDKFRDYWHGVPGQKGCKLDWKATFRNWMRNSGKPRGGGHGARSDAQTAQAAAFASVAAGFDDHRGDDIGGGQPAGGADPAGADLLEPPGGLVEAGGSDLDSGAGGNSAGPLGGAESNPGAIAGHGGGLAGSSCGPAGPCDPDGLPPMAEGTEVQADTTRVSGAGMRRVGVADGRTDETASPPKADPLKGVTDFPPLPPGLDRRPKKEGVNHE